jgi:hypothetical protein
MATKPLVTHRRLLELLTYDPLTGLFRWRIRPSGRIGAGEIAGNINPEGYRSMSLDRRFYKAHRLAWFYVHGVWPPEQLDHINRQRDDNRIANLRLATNQQNNANSVRQRNNTSGFKGVYFHKQKWRAMIGISGKRVHIGFFSTPEIAHAAYLEKSREVFGDFSHDGK